MYTATTRAILVTVRPQYLPDQSDPAKAQYVWAYQVRIENKGDFTVQLRSRHWKTTDGLGRLQEVKGPGVVGKTPMLRPGDGYGVSNVLVRRLCCARRAYFWRSATRWWSVWVAAWSE